MILTIDLSDIEKDYQIPFCKYLINKIQESIMLEYDKRKAIALENYINSGVIKWQYNSNKYISVLDLYRLYATNLQVTNENNAKFSIRIDENINIPDSYTNLFSIISLLEYGTLSVRKYGLIDKIYSIMVKHIDEYYRQFRLGEYK